MYSAEESRRWTITRRMASKTIPPTWNRNPMSTNLISPKDAITTPSTIKETLKRTFMLGCASPRPHVAKRTATGVVAYSND